MGRLFYYAYLICLISCGQIAESPDTATKPSILIGRNSSFTNPDLIASSEGIISIINSDDVPHTVTSQSAPGAFDNSGLFDILVPAESVQVLRLPAADSATVISFYCRLHLDSREPANGTLTIE